MRLIRWGAALPLLVAACAANATSGDFAACDGYAMPTAKSDGITKGTWLWGLATRTADFRRSLFLAGVPGILACDAALADPVLVDRFWLRRAHLLQSKALHQLYAQKEKGALDTLDQSDAVGASRGDAAFEGSIGLANDALRAIAYYRLGRKDDARKMLDSIEHARPWAGTLSRLTGAIRGTYETDYDTYKAILKAQAPLDPGKLQLLFWLAMSRGEFEEALSLGREIEFESPRSRHDWQLDDDSKPYAMFAERASLRGASAYALFALGREEESAREYKRALTEIEQATAHPKPDRPGKPISKAKMADFQLRKFGGKYANDALLDWARAIDTRREVPKLDLAAFARFSGRPHEGAKIIALDLFRNIKAADMKEAETINRLLAEYAKRQEDVRVEATSAQFTDLVKLLPRPEVAGMVPQLRREGGEILRSSLNGWAVRDAEDPELFNVRFGHETAGNSLVEEAGLLAAANHTAALGKDGFIIEARQFIQRTTNTVAWYGPTTSTPSGYEIRLLVRPVRVDALPPAREGSRWRVVKVADVQAALARKFGAQR